MVGFRWFQRDRLGLNRTVRKLVEAYSERSDYYKSSELVITCPLRLIQIEHGSINLEDAFGEYFCRG